MHPVYTKEYVESIKPSHRPPVKVTQGPHQHHTHTLLALSAPSLCQQWAPLPRSRCTALLMHACTGAGWHHLQLHEKAGYFAVQVLRRLFDMGTGCAAAAATVPLTAQLGCQPQRAPLGIPPSPGVWSPQSHPGPHALCALPSTSPRPPPPHNSYGSEMTESKWLQRFLFLETVAGVPGMVAGEPPPQTCTANQSIQSAGMLPGVASAAVLPGNRPTARSLRRPLMHSPPPPSAESPSSLIPLPPPPPPQACCATCAACARWSATTAGSTRCWRRPRTSACTC